MHVTKLFFSRLSQIEIVQSLERGHLLVVEVHEEELAIFNEARPLEPPAGRADEENGLSLLELDGMDLGIRLHGDVALAELAGDGRGIGVHEKKDYAARRFLSMLTCSGGCATFPTRAERCCAPSGT